MIVLDELRDALSERPTDELVDMLKVRDEQQWRPEVFEIVESILAGRGVGPVPQEPGRIAPVDVVEDEPMSTIARHFSSAEAHTARAALESGGIEAWVTDETTGSSYGVAVGIRLRVRKADETAARELLRALEEAPITLPPEMAAPPCPECGATGGTQTSELMEGSDPGGGDTRLRRYWYYECVACNHRWQDDGI